MPEMRGRLLESIEVAFGKSHYAVEWRRTLLSWTRRAGRLRQRRGSRSGGGEPAESGVMDLEEVGGDGLEDKRDEEESAVVG